MAQANHREYYERREREARALAGASSDPEIRRIHAEMAERYSELAIAAPPAGESAAKPAKSHFDLN